MNPMSTSKPTSRPVVVCLIGSRRFESQWTDAANAETLAGKIVQLPHVAIPDYIASAAVRERLDELHLRRIDLADEILVINVGGYIGKSTARELAYAVAMDKRIRFLVPPTTDQVAEVLGKLEEARAEIVRLTEELEHIRWSPDMTILREQVRRLTQERDTFRTQIGTNLAQIGELAASRKRLASAYREIDRLTQDGKSTRDAARRDAAKWHKLLTACRDKNLDLQKRLDQADYEIVNLVADSVAFTKRIVVLTDKLDVAERRIADLLNDRKVHLGIIDELRNG